jgi:Alpha-amylase/alpha-mannosidase
MATPSDVIAKVPITEKLSVPNPISWADKERNLSPWLGNDMQQDAFESLAKIGKRIRLLHDNNLLRIWRYLQTSDHFYYMSTKKGDDGNVHTYFSPYPSPYEAFINYMNVLSDFSLQVKSKKARAQRKSKKSKVHPELHKMIRQPVEN